MTKVAEHFNLIAKDYDYWKKKNWYYYSHLKKTLKDLIPDRVNVLDVGCGTGDILADLKPYYGLGIDISSEMIKIAQLKYKEKTNVEFLTGTIEELVDYISLKNFDYIFMADVIEHLEDLPSTIENINKVAKPSTKIIISMANPLWQPILLILEKLKLKMPEGPHQRISIKKIENIFLKNNLGIIQKDYRLILPCYIPIVSNIINKCFYKISFLKALSLIVFLVFKRNE